MFSVLREHGSTLLQTNTIYTKHEISC